MAEHGGNIRFLGEKSGLDPEKIIDFSASINPLGPPEWLRRVVSRELSGIRHYPDPDSFALREKISGVFSLPFEGIVTGNGSTELFYAAVKCAGSEEAILPVPSYGDYEDALIRGNVRIHTVPLREDEGFIPDLSRVESRMKKCGTRPLVFIGNPNNPTGCCADHGKLQKMAEKYPGALFFIDEAFADFIPDFPSALSWKLPNCIVFRSFTKFYGIPGLRLGFAFCEDNFAQKIRNELPGWSVNSLAQAAGVKALNDTEYQQETIKYVAGERQFLEENFSKLGIFTIFPSRVNYFLCKLKEEAGTGSKLSDWLLSRGIAVRSCGSFSGLSGQFIRFAVRTRRENILLCERLGEYRAEVSGKSSSLGVIRKPKKPALMFQGTSSNAGKSVLAAAMCRVLYQDGFKAAPFKAQNMALNSFVTVRGGEMGRAQAVQARACGIEPDVRMNPVLLKPSSDTGAQVILMGKPLAQMTAADYYPFKKRIVEEVHQAYDSLSGDFDALVLEGAGSPGEVNLKKHDIVNMHMAEYADAPVILVGDIDRGGVFASFIGTMEVLTEVEREYVHGFLVNRFRGDSSLLEDAFSYVYEHTGRKIFGVMPYIRDLNLPEEDAVTFKEQISRGVVPENEKPLKIAVIDLPHISNFTDIDPFKIEKDVALAVLAEVPRDPDFSVPDAVIIPGSKNVIGDLKILKEKGFFDYLISLALEKKTEIIGICGGYQMLGEEIRDPLHIESGEASGRGFGLLDIVTELKEEKTLKQRSAVHEESGAQVMGYEIHHGKTLAGRVLPLFAADPICEQGCRSESAYVWGTYLHGVFDDDGFRNWFLNRLRKRRGFKTSSKNVSVYSLDSALDRLAEQFRESVDVPQLYKLMGL